MGWKLTLFFVCASPVTVAQTVASELDGPTKQFVIDCWAKPVSEASKECSVKFDFRDRSMAEFLAAQERRSLKEWMEAQAPIENLDRFLRKLAGNEAIDCGQVSIDGPTLPASDCALKAFRAKKPFFVRYTLQGIDSFVGSGAAFDGDNGFAADFTSNGWSVEGEVEMRAATSVIGFRCPKPVRFWLTRSGRISCYPPQTPEQFKREMTAKRSYSGMMLDSVEP
jgi:hypothetical protein